MLSCVLLFSLWPSQNGTKATPWFFFVQCQDDNCRTICHILWLSVHCGECQNVWVETILVWAMDFWALVWLAGMTVWPLPGLPILESHAPPWTHPGVICNVLRGPIFHWPFVSLLVNISWSGFLPTGSFLRAWKWLRASVGMGAHPVVQNGREQHFCHLQEGWGKLLIT